MIQPITLRSLRTRTVESPILPLWDCLEKNPGIMDLFAARCSRIGLLQKYAVQKGEAPFGGRSARDP
jgi:hypothetical protein